MPTKKLFIIVLIFFIIASASLVIYNFVLPQNDSGDKTDSGQEKPLSLEIEQVSAKKAFSLAITDDSQGIKYYLKDDGQVVKSNFDGSSLSTVADVKLPELYRAVWSPDKKKVISFFQKPEGIKRYSFDYTLQKGVALSENIKSVAWSPSSEKIVYQYIDGINQQNSITVANADTSNWKIIFQTRLENLVVFWPVPDKIYFFDTPSGNTKGSLYSLGYPSGNFKKIISDQFGLSAIVSPDGRNILYQTTEEGGKNLKLFISSSDGAGAKELPAATLVEKCVWSLDSQNIFCAVPQNLSQNAVWPDNYSAGGVSVKDDFYLIDAATNKKIKIAGSDNQQSFDATELTLSPLEDYLFFIDRVARFVYGLKLKL